MLTLRPLTLVVYPFALPLATVFCSNGLGEGVKAERDEALPLADAGDELMLSGLALRDPGSRYFGGVT